MCALLYTTVRFYMCSSSFIKSFYSSYNDYYDKLSSGIYHINLRFFDYDILLSSLYHIILLLDQKVDLSDVFISHERLEKTSFGTVLSIVLDFINFIVNNFIDFKNHLINDTSLSTRDVSRICRDLVVCVENLEDFYCFLKCKIEDEDL